MDLAEMGCDLWETHPSGPRYLKAFQMMLKADIGAN